jgi:hypothetical protein
MSINDSEIRVNIRRTSRPEEKKDIVDYFPARAARQVRFPMIYIDIFGGGLADIPFGVENEMEKNPYIILDIYKSICTKPIAECSVCLEKIRIGESMSTLDCAHTFHNNCINEWGSYKQECPLCRNPIPILEV